MKKFLSFAAIALCVSFTSCSDDDDNYVPKPIDVSTGAFIVNSGNMSSQISGSITSIDYSIHRQPPRRYFRLPMDAILVQHLMTL